jgi:aryl-alcohol dehydrogenase-like predicted oxidoreductase
LFLKHGTYSRILLVRLGKSGLKVSRIILGCMTYGSTDWQSWVLDEKAGLEHIKAAYDAGINAFDTANVSGLIRHSTE